MNPAPTANTAKTKTITPVALLSTLRAWVVCCSVTLNPSLGVFEVDVTFLLVTSLSISSDMMFNTPCIFLTEDDVAN